MKFKEQNILLISPERWDHIFVSKHHYAIHLGRRGNKVYFLNPPSAKNEVMETGYKNVWQVNYKGFPKGLRFFPGFLQKRIINEVFKEVENICQLKFDVAWSFDNSVFYNFSALMTVFLKISHIVDLNQDFHTKTAAKTADVSLCTTEIIRSRLSKYNRHVFKVNHGLNLSKVKFTNNLPGMNKIKALYMGNMAMRYLDWEILTKVARENQHVDFIFIGSGRDEFNEKINSFHKYKLEATHLINTYFLDKVASEFIYSYLLSADILMIAYQEKHHADQANPHKMMEYLASGKMVIATNTQEYEAIANEKLILMSKQNSTYSKLFKSAINDLEYWNSIEKQKARKAFALENTYDKQIDRIEAIIKSLNEAPVS